MKDGITKADMDAVGNISVIIRSDGGKVEKVRKHASDLVYATLGNDGDDEILDEDLLEAIDYLDMVFRELLKDLLEERHILSSSEFVRKLRTLCSSKLVNITYISVVIN